MAENHGTFRKQAERDHAAKLRHHTDGDVKQDKALIKEAFAEHDKELHPGKHTRLKFKDGGHVEGEKKAKRLDRATGGRTKSKGGHKTTVNIVMPQGGHDQPSAPPPMLPPPHPPMAPPPPPPGPAGMGAGAPPPRPPMGPPVGAGAPMPGRKTGGRVSDYDGGAGGGEARLEKIKKYGSKAEGDLEDKGFADDSENKKMARGGRS
jgi:hypothetical protein